MKIDIRETVMRSADGSDEDATATGVSRYVCSTLQAETVYR